MNHVISVADQLQGRLRIEVLTGGFPPGERLKEEPLAERFGVGRAVLRETFRQLVQEGLLVAKRNCGVSVAPPPNALVQEALTPVRQTLETYALRRWFERRAPAHFATWERVLAKMRLACEARDHGGIMDADMEFHGLIFEHAGLEELLPVWRPAILQLRAYHVRRNQRHDDADLIVIHRVHEALLAVFRGKSMAAAEQALASHVTDGAFNQRVKRRYHAAQAKDSRRKKLKGQR